VTPGPRDPQPAGDPPSDARARVLALLDEASPLLIVSDFDGTLSPIVAEPGDARIIPVARRALRTLARVAEARPDRISLAVLSGRTAADVAVRVRVGGIRYYGSHGMEVGALARGVAAERLDVGLAPGLEQHVPHVEALSVAVARRLGDPDWLFVEAKGPSVGFHYRRAADPDAAREAILAALDAEERARGESGLARLESRRIVELRPVDAAGKGATLEALVAEVRPGAILVIGDDRTDAEAFAVVRALRNGPGRGVPGLAVGVRGGAETPPEIRETADVMVDGPRAAAAVLAALARALDREPAER